MKGFDGNFTDLPDYILKITYQIWEDKDVESIRKYYSEDIPLRTPDGVIYGSDTVVKATYATLNEFPDRQLLAEDVIWIGNDNDEFLSSHRIFSIATHQNDGVYGKATGKKLGYRVIADCACKNNQVYDEWLVRDQGAIVRQLGMNPKTYAANLIEMQGGKAECKVPFNRQTPHKVFYNQIPISQKNSGTEYASILSSIFQGNFEIMDKTYDRAVNQEQPGGFKVVGINEVKNFWINLKNAFPDAEFKVDHIAYLEEKNEYKKASIRWSLEGKHSGKGFFSDPSQANIHIMGINHVEFGPRGIKNEWVLFDETMIWKQILMQTG